MKPTPSLSLHFVVQELRDPLLLWYKSNKTAHAWRELWDTLRDPYHVWVSEIMLQQTTLAAVIPKYIRFVQRFPNLQSLAQASETEIRSEIQGLGYYRRFANMHRGMQQLYEKSEGREILWPRNYEEWLKIAGVGEYTAAAISSITLNESRAVLDGNVYRVLARIFDIQRPVNDPILRKQLQELANVLVCTSDPGSYNQALMELGQKICRPLNPSCEICPIQNICLARERQSTHLAPGPKVREAQESVKLRIKILQKGRLFGLSRRSNNAKFLRGSLGFVTEIAQQNRFRVDGEAIALPCGQSLGSFRHSITKHKISVEVLVVTWERRWAKESLFQDIQWLKKDELASQLMASLDLKAWKVFLGTNNHLKRFA